MVSISCLCVFILLVANVSEIYGLDIQSDLSTEESFIIHATEISNILHTLISLVKVAAENEGRLLNLPEIPFSLDFESATLEELFDKFERSCQSFRTKFLKFVKKELESIDPGQELVFTTSDLPSTSEDATEYVEVSTTGYPEHVVAVVNLESKSVDEGEDNYLGSVSDEVNSYADDSSTVYTLDETTGKYEVQPEVVENTAEILPEENQSLVDYDTASDNPSEADSDNQDISDETLYEAATKQALDQFLEEMSSFEEGKLKDALTDSERLLDRSGHLAIERPMKFLITSVPGVRGKDFPDYEDIPQTAFTCEDKEYIPGFYADVDADCQVFHVCWPDRIESFLCPSGTQFNQQILSCDYWFNLTCSQTPEYYSLNSDLPRVQEERFVTADSKDFDESLQALSLLGYAMKIMPVHSSTTLTKYKSASEITEPELDTETTVPVTEDLLHKMYEELYQADKSLEDRSNPDQLNESPQQKKQRSNAKFFRTKLDRAGPVSETLDSDEILIEIPVATEVYSDMVIDTSEESEVPVQTPLSEETADMGKRVFKKGVKKTYVDQSAIPVILNRLLETADGVINKQILPFTKEVLAASYSKMHKVKKH